MSGAASALLRALVVRAASERDRILLTDVQSREWCSLTLTGERHRFEIRIPGPESLSIVDRMCAGLEDAEFSIPRHIVADITVIVAPITRTDGSTELTIEALTVKGD